MKTAFKFTFSSIFLYFILICAVKGQAQVPNTMHSKTYTYLPLGDSYTICEGASLAQSWPELLKRSLEAKGKKIFIPKHIAVTGYTTSDLISEELPWVAKSKPDFVTLLIGVNDWVQGSTEAQFNQHLGSILDALQKQLKNPKAIILITIPDFSVGSTGAHYGGGRNIGQGILQFNAIIQAQAKQRNLPCVDIFEESRKALQDPSLISEDGLHPSAKGYAAWLPLILDKVEKSLN